MDHGTAETVVARKHGPTKPAGRPEADPEASETEA